MLKYTISLILKSNKHAHSRRKNQTMKFAIVLCIFHLVKFSTSAKILGFFVVPSISHQMVYRSLLFELSKRGHEITIITPNPIGGKHENYTEISIHELSYSAWRRAFDFGKAPMTSPEFMLYVFNEFFVDLVDKELSQEPVKTALNSTHFDLVFIEFLMFPSINALAHKFQAPLIGMSSLDILVPGHLLIGNPVNPAYFADPLLGHSDKKTFLERVRTTLFIGFWYFFYQYMVLPKHDAIAKKHFGPDTPYVGDIEKNMSLVLANSDFITGYPKPEVPAYVSIGGGNAIHLKKPQPLPKDIQEFLDDAKDGVIYFSLGSNVKSSTMPESKRAVFLEAFKQIKQKVLWKWETDDLPGKPDNVKLGKWLPQTDILAHPNIKLFITQGGLQSMGEATHNCIPMIVIPFFADQELNAKKLVSVGVAIRLDFETLTTEDVLNSINEVINNKEYKQNMEKYSALTKDQPQSPMERAVWWTEYVLRHNGARHLRSAAVDMPWYQYFLLDVIAFLLAVTLTALYLSYLIIRTIFRLIFKSKKTKKE